ncbi:hypothetical protein P22_1513 [Propionispora sp. 2/2-37]|uniref:dTMP kinase n=1 Tax=Propionispora sp. 2/2-37 TaxID=1677858 RepID=UPI0006BB5B4C|nr:thymidylate kinase [Propionispora sp. 2/2-37]CUH95442.1 hypothetical protein P22_1513 [Propionispora sp. 2/2-37]
MKGKLIILEAGDGSGKATQTAKLCQRLENEQHAVKKVEYPNYQSQSAALIKMYLQGKFGSTPDAVNPYAASAFYAVDRFASYKTDWETFYQQGGIVICDRYTTSNMVHQAVKIDTQEARSNFLDWLWDFEFKKMGLPVPDGVIFLDMPPAYSRSLLEKRHSKAGFSTQDIHERDQEYLETCYRCYRQIAQRYHWHIVNCVKNGILQSVDNIHQDVYRAATLILGS